MHSEMLCLAEERVQPGWSGHEAGCMTSMRDVCQVLRVHESTCGFTVICNHIQVLAEPHGPPCSKIMIFVTFSSSLPAQSKLPQASPLSPLAFPHCLQAPIQRLEQYCEALEELGGINPASDSALSILRHAQRHGEDLRASDLIVGCPVRTRVPVCDCATVKSHFLFLEGKKRKSCWGGQARGSDENVFTYLSFTSFYTAKEMYSFPANTGNSLCFKKHIKRIMEIHK